MFALSITRDQVRKLSDIFSDAAQVVLGSLVLQPLLDAARLSLVLAGIITACVAWLASLYLVQRASLI